MSKTVTVTMEDYDKFNEGRYHKKYDCMTHCLIATALRRHFNTENVSDVVYHNGVVNGVNYEFVSSDPDFCFYDFVDSALMGRLDPATLPITFELEPVNS